MARVAFSPLARGRSKSLRLEPNIFVRVQHRNMYVCMHAGLVPCGACAASDMTQPPSENLFTWRSHLHPPRKTLAPRKMDFDLTALHCASSPGAPGNRTAEAQPKSSDTAALGCAASQRTNSQQRRRQRQGAPGGTFELSRSTPFINSENLAMSTKVQPQRLFTFFMRCRQNASRAARQCQLCPGLHIHFYCGPAPSKSSTSITHLQPRSGI